MKTSSKKILTACLTLAMAAAMAVPVFADRSTWGYNYVSYGNIDYNLNAATETTPVAGTMVTMWEYSGSPTQRWNQVSIPGTSYYWLESEANGNVVLAYNGNPQARLATKDSSTYGVNTQGIKIVREGVAFGTYDINGLVLPAYALAVTATGYSNGSQVQWLGSNGQNNQLWLMFYY